MTATIATEDRLLGDAVTGARGILTIVKNDETPSGQSFGLRVWHSAIRNARQVDTDSPLAPLFAQADDRLAEARAANRAGYPDVFELKMRRDAMPALRALVGAADALAEDGDL